MTHYTAVCCMQSIFREDDKTIIRLLHTSVAEAARHHKGHHPTDGVPTRCQLSTYRKYVNVIKNNSSANKTP